MRTNVASTATRIHTHEGAPARNVDAVAQLRRTLLSCLLWEDTFYESGVDVARRIADLVPQIPGQIVGDMAVEARTKFRLRHAPLLVVGEMVRHVTHRSFVADALFRVIERPDELAEFLAIFWKDRDGNKKKLPKSVKRGLARAFGKFNEYSFAKYDRDGAIKLRDVMFLVHPKPEGDEQVELFKKIAGRTLKTPDTWEVALSSGANKGETFTRLIQENKLGALAMIRNLRNMIGSGVSSEVIRKGLSDMKVERVFPYRFITAARFAPHYEPDLELAMFKCIAGMEKIPGKTVLLVDISGSMDAVMSDKSEATRIDAACGLAVLAREICEDVRIFSFSNTTVEVPARRGFALRDAIKNSQQHGGTDLGGAVLHAAGLDYDRLIVFTDEQSRTAVPNPKKRGYMVNVASYQNGVGYGPWLHVDGFSEQILAYIREAEIQGD